MYCLEDFLTRWHVRKPAGTLTLLFYYAIPASSFSSTSSWSIHRKFRVLSFYTHVPSFAGCSTRVSKLIVNLLRLAVRVHGHLILSLSLSAEQTLRMYMCIGLFFTICRVLNKYKRTPFQLLFAYPKIKPFRAPRLLFFRVASSFPTTRTCTASSCCWGGYVRHLPSIISHWCRFRFKDDWYTRKFKKGKH